MLISAVKGPTSSKQEVREKLNIFLKGFNKKKDELHENEPDLFKHFSDIWKIRNSHMIRDLPSNYVFFRVCCYQPDCLHPVYFFAVSVTGLMKTDLIASISFNIHISS